MKNQVDKVIKDYLSKEGQNINNLSNERLFYYFFLHRNRRIPPKHYKIYESNEVRSNKLLPKIEEEYNQLIDKLKTKSNLSNYYTNSSKNLNSIDELLEDWNINHFHLCDKGIQLFFIAFHDNIFIINIYEHFGTGSCEYANEDLIQIIEDNWPSFIDIYRLKGVSSQTEGINKQSRYKLRKSSINTFVKTRGGFYCIGDGISHGHTSLKAQRLADNFMDWLDFIEENIKNEQFSSDISMKTNISKECLNFEIKFYDNEEFCLLEKSANKIVIIENRKKGCFMA